MITKNTEHGWNGSVYRDYRGDWMLSRDIKAIFGIARWKIERWGRNPCPYLRARREVERKKVANPFPGATGFNETIHVYLVVDVEEILANQQNGAAVPTADGMWLDKGIFEDAAGEKWISAPEAKRRYGIAKSSLWRWPNELPCRYLDGRHVRTKDVERRHLKAATLFSLADVEQIYARMPAISAPPPEYRDDEGVWLTNPQMQKRLGVSAIFCVDWSKKRWKGEPALRTKKVPDTRRRVNGFDVPVYLLSDALAIKNREKSKRKYQGRGAISNEYQKGLAKDAQEVLETILHDGPVALHEIKRCAKERHITLTILYRAKKKLDVKSDMKDGVCFWRLPGAAGKGKPKPAESNGHVPHLMVERLTVTHCEAETFKAASVSLPDSKPIPEEATLDSLPATHREYEKPDGQPLLTSFLEDKYKLPKAYLTRNRGDLKVPRIKVRIDRKRQKEFAYSWRDVLALKETKQAAAPDEETIQAETARLRARRTGQI